MEMPKDVKGKTVDIEAVRVLYRDNGDPCEVDAYVYRPSDKAWKFIDSEGSSHYVDLFLVAPLDSWEKLERDATDLSPCEYAKKRGLDAEYAFGSAMAQDIDRRARALAGDGE